MDRPLRLVLPVAVLAAVVVPLRGIVVFESVRQLLDAVTLSVLSRVLWSVLAVVGFPLIGYTYGEPTDGDRPPMVLGLAGAAAAVGSLVGALFVRLSTDATVPGSVPVEVGTVGVFAALDATMFGLFVLAGYALSGAAGRT